MEHEFLTDEEMAEIQQRYAEGFSMDTLAQMYDMTVADVAWVVQSDERWQDKPTREETAIINEVCKRRFVEGATTAELMDVYGAPEHDIVAILTSPYAMQWTNPARFTRELFYAMEGATLDEDLPEVAQHILKRMGGERVGQFADHVSKIEVEE